MADVKLRGWPAAHVPPMSMADSQTSPTDALAGFRVHLNGNIYTNENGAGYVLRFPWMNAGNNTLFQVKFVETIVPPGGALGAWNLVGFSWNTWTAMTATLDLELLRTSNLDGEGTGQASVSIKRISNDEIFFLNLLNFAAGVVV